MSQCEPFAAETRNRASLDGVVPIQAVRAGDRGRIVLIGRATSALQRLMAIGLVPGTQVSVERVAPLGDPIILDVGGFQVSLRRGEADGLGLLC